VYLKSISIEFELTSHFKKLAASILAVPFTFSSSGILPFGTDTTA
jgi:hypothetical protein